MSGCKVYLTRRETFAAAHRLNSSHLTDAENAALYGKCNNPNGHGHNYEVKVTLYGPVNEKTGMLMNVTELNKYIEQAVMVTLDHKHLDFDVPYFKERPSTVENVAIYIWKSIKKLLPEPQLLYEVMIHETENNTAVFRGEGLN